MLIAALLAIVLASGLGTASYSLFAETPISEKPGSVLVLDVYTQKGGQGPNIQGGSFMLNESVSLYGEIQDQLNKTGPVNKLISFEVKANHGETLSFVLVRSTNASSIATAVFRIPPDESFVGIWEIYARAEYNGTVLLDTLTSRCSKQG